MVSSVLSSLVCVLCVVVVPAVWGDSCSSYSDTNGIYHGIQHCDRYCCGDCSRKYCCDDRDYRLQEKYQNCPDRPTHERGSRTGMVLGSILGTIFPVLLCVGLIICCVAPCCYCYKKCRKGGHRRHTTVVNTTNVVNAPEHPFLPHGYPSGPPGPGYGGPSSPGYGGPSSPGYGGPSMPTAPPSYMESTDPAYIPVPFSPGQPMYPLQPPSQPYVPPPYPNAPTQPPFNPSYP